MDDKSGGGRLGAVETLAKAYVTVQLTELGMRLSGSIVPEATELLTNEGLTAL